VAPMPSGKTNTNRTPTIRRDHLHASSREQGNRGDRHESRRRPAEPVGERTVDRVGLRDHPALAQD
jgi:hypothetical protein